MSYEYDDHGNRRWSGDHGVISQLQNLAGVHGCMEIEESDSPDY